MEIRIYNKDKQKSFEDLFDEALGVNKYDFYDEKKWVYQK